MKLKVISTGSLGNCYILEASGAALIIECGARPGDVKQALDFNLRKVAGCVVSHSHQDHARYAADIAAMGIKVHASHQTIAEIKASHHNLIPVEAMKRFNIGEFQVMPFDLQHDVRCYGYLIKHHEMGLCLFITDTHYSPAVFQGLNNILIETNYSEQIAEQRLYDRQINSAYYDRVLRSHMSLETAVSFLEANDLKAVNNIVLIHLSDGNSNATQFKETISSITGKRVTVADKGLVMDFNKSGY